MAKIEQGKLCPLIGEDCRQLECSWYTKIAGTHPQTGEHIEEWGCAVAWIPFLQIDNKKNGGWIHISQLKQSKSFITVSNKILFKKPTKFSKPLAKIETGRLLLVKKCERNWCLVETKSFKGWVDEENLWGKTN